MRMILTGLLFLTVNWAYAVNVPLELKPYIDKDSSVLAYEVADLNGDNRQDYILVLERNNVADTVGQRLLKIIVRNKDNGLYLAKTNEKSILCSTCGGVMGDPFLGVEAKKQGFIINHFGGSSWKWSSSYRFKYSAIDNTWQLVMVEESSFHASLPEGMETKRFKPPKDYGKIDISDFDPENFKGIGPK